MGRILYGRGDTIRTRVGADIPASGSSADITPPSPARVAQPQGQHSPDGRRFWNGTGTAAKLDDGNYTCIDTTQ
jgi:hypothetical protein